LAWWRSTTSAATRPRASTTAGGSPAVPNTPDIAAGDEIRATATTVGTAFQADSSVVRDVALDSAVLGTDAVTFAGYVRSLPTAPIDTAPIDTAADVLELRVEPAGVRENLAEERRAQAERCRPRFRPTAATRT
jgi:hypothetical protein